LVLDIQKLVRRKIIREGVPKTDELFFLDGYRKPGSVRFQVIVNTWYPSRGDYGLQVFLEDGSTDIIYFRCVTQGIAKRWYFVLPEGEDRTVLARKLYLPPWSSRFDTCKAHKLRYRGQNLSKRDRIGRRILRLRERLGFACEIHGKRGPKPKRMRRKTFRELGQKLEELEWLYLTAHSRPRGRPVKWLEAILNPSPGRPAVARRPPLLGLSR